MSINTPANFNDRISRIDREVLEDLADALNAPDLSKNKYSPGNEYGEFLAITGADFARRIRENVNSGKIGTSVLETATLYAMNPLPGMIINKDYPFLGRLARPEVGRNLNTIDGAAGLNYENFTQVGKTISEELQNTGISVFGNLIEEAPARFEPGPSGPNNNFIRRASPVERVENVIENTVKKVASSLANKFINPSGIGKEKNEQWSDIPGNSNGTEFIGKYGEDNLIKKAADATSAPASSFVGIKRWTSDQEKRLEGAPINVAGFSIPTPSSFSSKKRFEPKNKLPSNWTQFDKTYDDGNAVDSFDTQQATSKLNLPGQDLLSQTNPWEQTLPLTITDLRSNQKIYLKAFLENLSEKYNPSWDTHNVFARPEPYYQWKSCTRQFSFRVGVYAFSPPELNVIYRKLNFLTQLQYATYHSRGKKAGTQKEPPLCRLRLGDLIKKTDTSTSFAGISRGGNVTVGSGLAGWIEGLSIEYPIDKWEMEAGSIVPKMFTVDISFNVIHEAPVSGDANFYDVSQNSGIGKSLGFNSAYKGISPMAPIR